MSRSNELGFLRRSGTHAIQHEPAFEELRAISNMSVKSILSHQRSTTLSTPLWLQWSLSRYSPVRGESERVNLTHHLPSPAPCFLSAVPKIPQSKFLVTALPMRASRLLTFLSASLPLHVTPLACPGCAAHKISRAPRPG
jgi:hypothetical protein